MIIKKNNLSLDFIKTDSGILPASEGFIISAADPDLESGLANIVVICWDAEKNNCYFKAIEDKFQTYIVSYETFKDFVYLLDEAYCLLRVAHNIAC